MSIAGTLVLADIVEEDRVALCGAPWARGPARIRRRGGHARGRLVLDGREVIVRRPRVHALDGGGELELAEMGTVMAMDLPDALERML